MQWKTEYLRNKKKQVLIEGTKSSKSKVKSGSIQGSVLGPVLFLMYFSDMTEETNVKNKKFVDDTKITKQIDDEQDVEKLQDELNKLFKWQRDNSMKFNMNFFQVLLKVWTK